MNERPERMNETYRRYIMNAEESRPGVSDRIEWLVKNTTLTGLPVTARLHAAATILKITFAELGYDRFLTPEDQP